MVDLINLITGGMGSSALIGQSLVNVQSGCSSRLSGVAMTLLPCGRARRRGTAARAGAHRRARRRDAAGVPHSTSAWSSLQIVGRVPKIDLAVVMVVSIVSALDSSELRVYDRSALEAINQLAAE